MKTFLVSFFFCTLIWPLGNCRAENADLVKVHVIPEFQSFAQNQVAQIGLQFEIKKGWHIYWLNPGDSGLAPQVTWKTNGAIELGAALWPRPEVFATEQMQNFGYEETVTMIQNLKILKSAAGARLTLSGKVEWLACQDICVPGKQEISIVLPVEKKALVDAKNQSFLKKANLEIPQDLPYWYIKVLDRDDYLLLKIMPQKSLPPQNLEITFFPITAGLPFTKISGKRHAANLFKIKKSDAFSKEEKILRGVAVANFPFDDEKKFNVLNINQPIQ